MRTIDKYEKYSSLLKETISATSTTALIFIIRPLFLLSGVTKKKRQFIIVRTKLLVKENKRVTKL